MVEGSRTLTLKKKPRVILDKRFSIRDSLNIGDEGQLIINGIIDGEKIDYQEDGVDMLVKKIRILSVEKFDGKTIRT